MNIKSLLSLLLAAIIVICTQQAWGRGLAKKTNQLEPGMTTAEVKSILGDPSQTQFIANKWIWKYSLLQPWKGYIPYYLIFGRESKTLEEWYADEAEYMRQQRLWLEVIPPTQKHEVEVKIEGGE